MKLRHSILRMTLCLFALSITARSIAGSVRYIVYKGKFKGQAVIDDERSYALKYDAYYIIPVMYSDVYDVKAIDSIDFSSYSLSDLDNVPVKIVFFKGANRTKYFVFPAPFIAGGGSEQPMYTSTYYMNKVDLTRNVYSVYAAFGGLMYGSDYVKDADVRILSAYLKDVMDSEDDGGESADVRWYNTFESFAAKTKKSTTPYKGAVAINLKNCDAVGGNLHLVAVSEKASLRYDKKLTEKGHPKADIAPVEDADSMAEAVERVCEYLDSKGYASTWRVK